MTLIRIMVLMIALIQFGCSDSSEISFRDAGPESTANLDRDNPVTISPDIAVKGTILNLRMDNSLLNNSGIKWMVDGIPDESSDSTRFETGHLQKGNTVNALIIKGDREYISNEITISNTAPSIIKAKLIPEVPSSVSTFTTEVNGTDIDNDFISYEYKWFVNDQYRGNDSFLETELKREDIVTVEISPTDRENSGKSVKLTSKVYNSVPVVSESTPIIEGNIYKYRLDVSDPDGDQLTFTIKKGPEGMSIDQSGILTWEIKPEFSGDHDIEVLINDNHDGEILVPISASISF